jgi:hypothetical protein
VTKEEYQKWKSFVLKGRPCLHEGRGNPCPNSAVKSSDLSPHDYVQRKKLGTLLCSRHLKEKESAE